MNNRILICGDSFSADFKHPDSWVTFLSAEYLVDNLSCAGISEYKILQQLKSKVTQLDRYSTVIVSHTSPNRVHIKTHPVHSKSKTHFDADLIFSDTVYHHEQNPADIVLETAKNYFVHIFDENYYQEIYYLIQEKIKTILGNRKVIHLDNFHVPNNIGLKNYTCLPKRLNLSDGHINHYDIKSNIRIFEFVKAQL